MFFIYHPRCLACVTARVHNNSNRPMQPCTIEKVKMKMSEVKIVRHGLAVLCTRLVKINVINTLSQHRHTCIEIHKPTDTVILL